MHQTTTPTKLITLFTLLIPCFFALSAHTAEHPFLLGRGITDVTGPARGMQMWGFVRDGQITEGIHTRLYSRAFVIAEASTPDDRIAFVSVDIGSITHDMQLDVVDRLQEQFGNTYTLNNVILSATHTHSGPGGYWHYGGGSPLGTDFSQVHFDFIIDGIIESIRQAHTDLEPGSIFIDRGTVEGGGANRSMVAYDANPAQERARYDSPTDKGMTLLKLVTASGPIGAINWFASHPTAMTFDNRLISGDHKGHASRVIEEDMDDGFVAAFAQTNCGDVTPNLNLNNTGPGENEFETTRIIAERQISVARELLKSASTPITGEISSHQVSINFRYRPVSEEYTNGAGAQQTCPTAMGYSMAAGSTEDGGGNPIFREGMKTRNKMIDGLVKNLYNMPDASDECVECHGVKPILFPTGEADPPMQTQVLPITLTRIGPLTLACVAAEVTTMSGRRLRESIATTLGTSPEQVIIVGYANDYGGYLTTKEEYDTQQYEGGHTLFGPWSLAAYQQEFDNLAKSVLAGTEPESSGEATDKRGTIPSINLVDVATAVADPEKIGQVDKQPKRTVNVGDTVNAVFNASDPRISFPQSESYIAIQAKLDDSWTSIATDRDWSTKVRWLADKKNPEDLKLYVSWDVPEGTPNGEYRIVYQDGAYNGITRSFKCRAR
ncbi:MAG: neutral/alkaline non-lysosomal ceramidase N-terminal domain-containing protein [Candidatus Hydrogenedentota bacterium]